ncbi:glucokinase [Aliiroseovarius sp.]|uniref:glucokinase n=1 Tax=Aliiroseovarius sp. TaxID=1872442 RepID=UPI002624A24E|nr:glucokinase [Aliiroseovarius sp.]
MTDSPANPLSLLADIGGTNTRVALARGTGLLRETIRRFRNAEHDSLDSVLGAYLRAEGQPACAGACVAVAGPVRGGEARLTNLDWTITRESLARATGTRVVSVLNDLQAQGHALGHLPADAVIPVHEARPTPGARMLVIGMGTGFNCAPVHSGPETRVVPPSEAGHASLPVRSTEELDLAAHLQAAHGYASVEEVLSGRGLAQVQHWWAERTGETRRMDSDAVLAAAAARDGHALEVLSMFVRVLGRVTGDLGLVHLPYGGIFLVGGMSNAVAPWLPRLGFAEALGDKGRFSNLSKSFPVSVVSDDWAALTGCAHHLMPLLEKSRSA